MGRFLTTSAALSHSRMSSGALFPSLVPGSRGSSSKYLVEFRAGKMSLKGSTVTPDKRKGLVYIQQTDDSLIHFCWKDRTSGNVEDVSTVLCFSAEALSRSLSCLCSAGAAERASPRQITMRTPLWPDRPALSNPLRSEEQMEEGLGRRVEVLGGLTGISGYFLTRLFLLPRFPGFDYFS